MAEHRIRRKSYPARGDAHEFTFSCYRRHPFLLNSEHKKLFFAALNEARDEHDFLVCAYVVMPEHVHVLIWPLNDEYDLPGILQSMKQGVGQKAIFRAKRRGDADKFLEPSKSGKMQFRFWQAGGGYDRNFRTAKAIWAAIRYIHNNPVARKLVENPGDWEWSSYNAYEGVEGVPFRVDRCEVWLDE